jgi:AbrB family looped-hinge helix DNA binding protein
MTGPTFYGTTTVGTKGQVVIPAEARQSLDIKPGDKLFVASFGEKKALGLIPADSLESLMRIIGERLESLREVHEDHKKEQNTTL